MMRDARWKIMGYPRGVFAFCTSHYDDLFFGFGADGGWRLWGSSEDIFGGRSTEICQCAVLIP